MTFLEVLCVGMSGYLLFMRSAPAPARVPSIAEGAIPAAIFQFVTAGLLGTGDGGWPAMVGKSAPIAALPSSRPPQARSFALGSPPGLR
jgi:hypothetical protein